MESTIMLCDLAVMICSTQGEALSFIYSRIYGLEWF
jgi:hypothetical protein